MSAKSLFDQISEAKDIEEVSIEIPAWGVDLLLLTPSMSKRAQLMEAQIRSRDQLLKEGDGVDVEGTRVDMTNVQFSVIQACCFDPTTREPVFLKENAERDLEMLKGKSGKVVWDLFEACQQLSGLSGATEDEEGPVDAGKDDS